MTIKQILFVVLWIVIPCLSIAKSYYTATTDLNVRTNAGKQYPVSFTLEKGDEVEVLSTQGDWYKIKYSGQVGYAYAKYLKPTAGKKSTSSQAPYADYSALAVLFVLGAIASIWLLPIFIIISSGKTTSGEKIAWVLAVLFISWFAWIFYMLLAPLKKKEKF